MTFSSQLSLLAILAFQLYYSTVPRCTQQQQAKKGEDRDFFPHHEAAHLNIGNCSVSSAFLKYTTLARPCSTVVVVSPKHELSECCSFAGITRESTLYSEVCLTKFNGRMHKCMFLVPARTPCLNVACLKQKHWAS